MRANFPDRRNTERKEKMRKKERKTKEERRELFAREGRGWDKEEEKGDCRKEGRGRKTRGKR